MPNIQPVGRKSEETKGRHGDIGPSDKKAKSPVPEDEAKQGERHDTKKHQNTDLGSQPIDENDDRACVVKQLRGMDRKNHANEIRGKILEKVEASQNEFVARGEPLTQTQFDDENDKSNHANDD
jgi:hypothetical protein